MKACTNTKNLLRECYFLRNFNVNLYTQVQKNLKQQNCENCLQRDATSDKKYLRDLLFTFSSTNNPVTNLDKQQLTRTLTSYINKFFSQSYSVGSNIYGDVSHHDFIFSKTKKY